MFTSFLRKVASKNNFQTSKMFAANMTGFLWNVSVLRNEIEGRTMPVPKEIVTSAIEGNDVVIFSKKSCPFCKMAKEVFKKLNQAYHAVELDELKECQEIQDILEDMTGARTVPRVFIKGEFIGGGSDVKKLYESGELQKKL